MRYYFFLQLVDAGISPEQMILERSHRYTGLQNKEIDLTIIRPEGSWDFEMKSTIDRSRVVAIAHERSFVAK